MCFCIELLIVLLIVMPIVLPIELPHCCRNAWTLSCACLFCLFTAARETPTAKLPPARTTYWKSLPKKEKGWRLGLGACERPAMGCAFWAKNGLWTKSSPKSPVSNGTVSKSIRFYVWVQSEVVKMCAPGRCTIGLLLTPHHSRRSKQPQQTKHGMWCILYTLCSAFMTAAA